MIIQRIHNYSVSFLALYVLFTLTACGGGGGGGGGGTATGGTATGVFKDSNVSGMTYVSGAQSGLTGTDGSFTYEVGNTVTFSVGGVTVGSTTGKSLVTPIDLVTGGDSNNTQVQNIVRFLLMLDENGDPDDSITISSAVQAVSSTWSQVDFTTNDLATELTTIISDAATADSTAHTLPTIATAQAHLESTLLCARAGAYRGTFSGDDNGPFGILVDAGTGLLSGFAYANLDEELLVLSGQQAVTPDQNATFVTGNVSSGATFSGQFTGVDQLGGSWQLSPFAGTFSGARIGGAANAAYRFTGAFSGDARGLFSFDVDNSDNVTGVAYTVFANGDGVINELSSFSGTVSGSILSAEVRENGLLSSTISGTLNKNTGALSGTWFDNEANGNSGTFSGSGCKLN